MLKQIVRLSQLLAHVQPMQKVALLANQAQIHSLKLHNAKKVGTEAIVPRLISALIRPPAVMQVMKPRVKFAGRRALSISSVKKKIVPHFLPIVAQAITK